MLTQEEINISLKSELIDNVSTLAFMLNDPVQKLMFEINRSIKLRPKGVLLPSTYNTFISRINTYIKYIVSEDTTDLVKLQNILMIYRNSRYLSKEIRIRIIELLIFIYSLLSFNSMYDSKYLNLRDKAISKKLDLL